MTYTARLWRDGAFEREMPIQYGAETLIVPRMVPHAVSVDVLFMSPPAEVLRDRYNPKYAHYREFFEQRRGYRVERDVYRLTKVEGDVLTYEFEEAQG